MADGRVVIHDSHEEPHERWLDEVIANLAARQHGVVGRLQLLALGFGRGEIDHRIERRRLHRVFRGVYSPSPIVSGLGRWMAATLAIGPDATLSHASAGALCAVRPSSSRIVDLTVPRALGRRDGLRLHRSRLPDDERTEIDGIPVTTPARTLLDLAALLTPAQLEQALARTDALRLTHSVPLAALLDRHPRRPGTANLRRILAERDHGVAEPGLEERFLEFVAALGLPRPELNAWLRLGERWIKADCLWREQRLIVELDSRSHHDTVTAFEADRDRDRRALVAGWRTTRVTNRMLEHETDKLERDLTQLVVGATQPRAA